MNLALHGFLLQVFLSILNFHHGRLLCSAGEPGYLDFDNLPETNFSCQGKVIGGYYADVEAGCQMFHVCTIGQKDEIMDIKFLCLNGTVFDQETRVCERVDEVDCSKSERFYNLNLELYGNNAVTLSLHESDDDEDDLSDPLEDHQQRTTSARPSTTSTTSTTTSRPSKPSTTAASGLFQHPAGYPQHYQPQPLFPQVHTSQSKSLYDDKNGGYHHQYIFHNGERSNNQATSYQLFSNQGVSSTTVASPQIHQIRFSSTVGPQIIHQEPSTVTPLFHATSSTIQTLLNSNANSPALINPIYHNHGIASTTEQFTVHSNNPRETSDYNDNVDPEQNIRSLEAIQSTNKGKISKLAISSVPIHQESSRTVKTKTSQTSQQHRISNNFLPTPATIETTIRSFYPTPRPSPKPSSSHSVTHQVTQHIHIPPVTIPQLKPHQITINLAPPDIQRIVQNPSPLLPSQSRVIVTAKASVSDESGRPLNTTQLVTLPLPTIPASYDDYKEGDESFDPFYRDVPKIIKSHRIVKSVARNIRSSRRRRSLDQTRDPKDQFIRPVDSRQEEEVRMVQESERHRNEQDVTNEKNTHGIDVHGFRVIQESLIKFEDILFSGEVDEDSFRSSAKEIKNSTDDRTRDDEALNAKPIEQVSTIKHLDCLEDLKTEASRHLNLDKEDDRNENEESKNEKTSREDVSSSIDKDNKKTEEKENVTDVPELKLNINTQPINTHREQKGSREDVIDVVILDSGSDFKTKPAYSNSDSLDGITKTDAVAEVIIEEETKSAPRDISKINEKFVHDEQTTKYSRRDESMEEPSSIAIDDKKQIQTPPGTIKRKTSKDSRERKSNSRRKGSRIRSSRRRMSSRIKQQRMNNVQVIEMTQQKEETHETTMITDAVTTTSTPSSILSETKAVEQIDSRIFEEPTSQTSKEIDTRAISQHDTTYSNSLRTTMKHGSKDEEMEGSFPHQVTEEYTKNLEQPTDKSEEQQSTQSTSTEDINFTENPQNREETVSTEITNVSEEEKFSDEEFVSEEYEALDVESITDTNEEVDKESSKEAHNKVSSHETATSRENKSDQERSSHHKDKSEKSDSEEEERLIAKNSEEVDSEELSEYYDMTESSMENTRDISNQEDYKNSESTEESIASMDYTSSEEYTDSQEDIAYSTEEIEESTEGVLKFTDELPKSYDTDNQEDMETRELSKSDESNAHDYVDDNYEPENYKELELTTKSNNLKEGNNKEKNQKNKNAAAKASNHTETIEANQKNDNVKEETQTEHVENVTESVDLDKEVTNLATTSSITTVTSTTTSTSTTTTSTTTTTPRSTTITTRTTSPKFFKPISARKIYAYIPPTTTPNPVIIKPRVGLFNPKPAKPPKSYNELVPKPVIRKLPLLSRVPSTTVATTTTTTTTTAATEKLNTETREITIGPVPTTTESSRSEENVLESKLEAKDHESASLDISMRYPSDTVNKEDQLPSPSLQDSSVDTSKESADSQNSNKKLETFTPYPLSRLSTFVSPIEETTMKAETKPHEITEKIDIATAVLPTTLRPEKSTHVETRADEYPDEVETSTAPFTTVHQQDVTETLSILSERPTSTTPLTITIQPKIEDSTFVETTEPTSVRPSHRRPTSPRKYVSFNCLEKEMYRFYGDIRDCRLFHYCSPGFTSRQVLDFRFVCEEGTAFDEVTQSCRHEVRNRKCRNRSW